MAVTQKPAPGRQSVSKKPPSNTKESEGQNGQQSQLQKAMSLASYFLSGAMAINASQFLGAPLSLINKDWYNSWIAWTKESFGLLTMTMTQWFAPTTVKVSGDKTMRGQLTKNEDGTLRCLFPNRLVLMANHQIYTDWMYLWWIAYTNDMHGRLYIILKESLKKIPVLGWGMQLSQFIFMKRNWEKDKPNLQKHMAKLRRPSEPMWLVLFPEGTNLAASTRERSRAWARKNGISDMQHQLLPRSTGLQFCLQQLQGSLDYLYDCTIAYEGVARGQYAQDIFTLQASYIEGRPPKAVHIYWRRFAISSIPLQDHDIFEKWLTARWREKDYLLEMWHRNGHFPADVGVDKLANGLIRRGCGRIETQIRPSQWYEFLQIFAPMGVLALVLSVFYGALPEWFLNAATKQAIQAESVPIPKVQVNGTASTISWPSFLDPDKQGGVVQQFLQKLIPTPTLTLPSAETPEEVDREVAAVQSNFYKRMEEEQASRKTRGPKAPIPKVAPRLTVKFSQALKNEQAKRQGSVVTSTTAKSSAAATTTANFSQNLRDEMARRNGTVITERSQAPSIKTAPTSSFWGDFKAEEAKRRNSMPAKPKKLTPKNAGTSASNIGSQEPKSRMAAGNLSSGPVKKTPARNMVNESISGKNPNGTMSTDQTIPLASQRPKPPKLDSSKATEGKKGVNATTKSVAISKAEPAKAAKTGITNKFNPAGSKLPNKS